MKYRVIAIDEQGNQLPYDQSFLIEQSKTPRTVLALNEFASCLKDLRVVRRARLPSAGTDGVPQCRVAVGSMFGFLNCLFGRGLADDLEFLRSIVVEPGGAKKKALGRKSKG